MIVAKKYSINFIRSIVTKNNNFDVNQNEIQIFLQKLLFIAAKKLLVHPNEVGYT
jgi:hypothetical protein